MAGNVEIVKRFYNEMWNRFDFSLIPDLLHPNFRFRGSLGNETRWLAQFTDYMRLIQSAFPDFTNTIEETVSEGNRTFARLTYRGTHRGPILGFPATNRPIEYAGAALFRFENDLIAEAWVLGDLHLLTRQLAGRP